MKPFEKATLPEDAPIVIKGEEVYVNDKYQVNVRKASEDGGWVWLSIKRLDKQVIHDWRDLQQIKNMICGSDREALELYPAESRLVDSSNQYHLFVLPEGERFPFGYGGRLVVDGQEGGWQKAGQRPFEEDEKPADIISPAEAEEKAKKYFGGQK
jgi:hypothetical protein